MGEEKFKTLDDIEIVGEPEEHTDLSAMIYKNPKNTEGIILDDEFKNLIAPLSKDELFQLEENILAEGIRDPLTVWDKDGKSI